MEKVAQVVGEQVSEVYRVLVVDGDENLLALDRLALSKHGFEVETATSASDALVMMGDRPPDLVVLDVVLPDLSGWELLRRVRASSDEVAIMLLTGRDSDVDKARGLDLGADDYLTKPFSLLEFEARVRALLRRTRRAPVSSVPAGTKPAGEGPTVAIIAERRHLENHVLRGVRSALEATGCTVPFVVPDSQRLFDIPDSAPPWDAVLSRGRDLSGLGLLAAASALGVVAINAPRSIELVRNKIAMHAVLQEHEMPLPKTWFASDAAIFRSLPLDCFPLVVKPYDGDGSAGLALLRHPEDVELLPDLRGTKTLYLAQEYLETEGWDLKLYGIGSQVWAVRKPSPVHFLEPGPAALMRSEGVEMVEVDAELRDIALTCGRACGLELWGVDVAMTKDVPHVIEVNDFPTYSGIPEAGALIAQHTLTRIQSDVVVRQAGRGRMMSVVRIPA
jgi:DNA-binding response OmpR family regulator/glutathione synthase/RimK-type ligase-like ATP-grasp enzyme